MSRKPGAIQLGLRQYLAQQPIRKLAGAIGYPILGRYRNPIGVVFDQDIDLCLNFMGYRYFDDIGYRETIGDARMFSRLKKLGATNILLPQAVGPLTSRTIRSAAKTLFESCSQIYVRDNASADVVASLGLERPVVVPDITIAAEGCGSVPENLVDKICIIPNRWMFERVSQTTSKNYLDLIRVVMAYSDRNGIGYYFLSHAPFQDDEILSWLSQEVGRSIQVVHPRDGLHAKAIIGKSRLVVSARYHGLVSALSQGVPAIASSWAHKYEQLLESYGLAGYVIADPVRSDINELLDRCLHGKARDELVNNLVITTSQFKSEIEAMWASIFDNKIAPNGLPD